MSGFCRYHCLTVQRETQINLIFLSVFLVLASPSAVILVHKTLKNGGNRISAAGCDGVIRIPCQPATARAPME